MYTERERGNLSVQQELYLTCLESDFHILATIIKKHKRIRQEIFHVTYIQIQ